MLNEERRKENLGDVSADTFEAVIDMLEKEWFDLVSDKTFETLIMKMFDIEYYAR